MKISQRGIDLIKEFEGCDLKATKAVPTEKYYTIGYGHYGADVKVGQTITKKEAEQLLLDDLVSYEAKVFKYDNVYHFNQNEYDALVSFCYNVGNIDTLTAKGTRSKDDICKYILKYNKSGGKVYEGLTKRRKKELELFNTKIDNANCYYPKCNSKQTSLVDGLKEIGAESNYSARKKIAIANGISNYSGLGSQNTTLLVLLKRGILIKF